MNHFFRGSSLGTTYTLVGFRDDGGSTVTTTTTEDDTNVYQRHVIVGPSGVTVEVDYSTDKNGLSLPSSPQCINNGSVSLLQYILSYSIYFECLLCC